EWLELVLRDVDLQKRDVVARVSADERGVDRVLVVEADFDLARALHDVRVGEDVSALVYDEARPGSRSPLLLRETEGGLDSLHDLRADEDDARPVAVIDLADGEAAAGPLCRGLRERALDDRCLLVLADPSGAD